MQFENIHAYHKQFQGAEGEEEEPPDGPPPSQTSILDAVEDRGQRFGFYGTSDCCCNDAGNNVLLNASGGKAAATVDDGQKEWPDTQVRAVRTNCPSK